MHDRKILLLLCILLCSMIAYPRSQNIPGKLILQPFEVVENMDTDFCISASGPESPTETFSQQGGYTFLFTHILDTPSTKPKLFFQDCCW